MNDVVRLPLEFDSRRLLKDLDQIPSALWTAHFNPADHEGGWSVLALYSPTGSSSFILPMRSDSVDLIETPILLQCPYLKEVVESFRCPKRSVRLLRLHSQGTVNSLGISIK